MTAYPRQKGTKGTFFQVTYREGRPLAAYIHLDRRSRERSVRSEEVAPEIVVDYSADGRPLGFEIVSPEVTSIEDVFRVFDELGLGRAEASELAPLVAG